MACASTSVPIPAVWNLNGLVIYALMIKLSILSILSTRYLLASVTTQLHLMLGGMIFIT